MRKNTFFTIAIMRKLLVLIFTFSLSPSFGQVLIKVDVDNFLHTNGTGNTALGIKSGDAITTGSNNTFLGYQSGFNNTSGNTNTFVGGNSGYSNILGVSNSFLGHDSGIYSTGDQNTFIGKSAGRGTLSTPNSGDNNTYIGYVAGYTNSTGNSNSFIGHSAGRLNTTGSNNVFLGYLSGYSNDSGNSNTFIGRRAGYTNISGTSNSFLGLDAGFYATGNYNTIIGSLAGRATQANPNTGDYNTFLGNNAGYVNTTGGYNTSIGHSAGSINTTGSYNIFLGAFANSTGANSTLLERSAAIGYNAKVSINDAIVLGDYQNNNLKIGIGVHNPQYRLDVNGVVNMRIGFNSPAIKINQRDFMGIDENEEFWVSNYKIRYENENQWSDKVFEENYKLLTISELEKFVTQNKHLPNIPSAKEVVEKGVNNADITSKLLEKIEEMSLYIIQLEKRIAEIEKK